MRRPLFGVCLCLVAAAALRLALGTPAAGSAGGGPAVSMSGAQGMPALMSGAQGTFISMDDAQRMPAPIRDKDELTVMGRVYRKNENNFYIDSVVIQQCAAYPQQTIPIAYNLIIEWEEGETEEELLLGSTVTAQGIFRTFRSATNPGEFDQAGYYRILGIGGKMTEVELPARSSEYAPLREGLHRLRRHWKERLYRVFPEKEASIMCTMLLGDRDGLDQDTKELYQRNGIVHILSISGLHITMLGMGIYRLLRRMGAPPWLAALCGGGILILYGIMTGLSVSACRAIGMYLIRMLAQITGRTYDMLTALGVMAAVMVLGEPLYLGHSGFLLSFASVLGIGVVYPAFSMRGEDRGKAGEKPLRYEECRWKAALKNQAGKAAEGLKQSILAGLSITAATLPVQLWFYYEIPTYSVLVNLFVLPCMGLVMAAGLVAMMVPGLGIVGTVDCLVLWGYEKLCGFFELLPLHRWNPGRPAWWQMLLYYGFLLAAAGWMQAGREGGAGHQRTGINRAGRNGGMGKDGRGGQNERAAETGRAAEGRKAAESQIRIKHKIIRKARLTIVLTILVIIVSVRFPQGNTVTFLDVGQGDGICLGMETGRVYLFDCGSSSRSQVGKYVLKPFLKYYGFSHINGIFVSHGDSDHCNGIEELLVNREEWGITVDCLILPGTGEEAFGSLGEAGTGEKAFAGLIKAAGTGRTPVEVFYIEAGEGWQEGGVTVKCLHPPAGYYGQDANAGSQCFYVDFGANSMLLTGDVEGEGEDRLLEEMRRQEISGITVLKIAHHGSRNSTSAEFLEQAAPGLAVISCGRNNRYGHPHGELLERLEQAGSYILKTAEQGAVTLKFGRGGVEAYPWLDMPKQKN